MKFVINQIVFSIVSREGKILIESMMIDKIVKDHKLDKIAYYGEMIQGGDSTKGLEFEERLYPTREAALEALQIQLDHLRKQK